MEGTMEMTQVNNLAAEYEAIRSVYDELEEKLKEAKAQKDDAEKKLIMAILDMEEKTGADHVTVNFAGRNYSVKKKDYFRIPKAEQDVAFQLLKELGKGDIVVEKVDDRTLTKEMEYESAEYRKNHPDSAEDFPAEYEELLAHMERYTKPSLSRVMAR